MKETLIPSFEKAFGCHIFWVKPRRNVLLMKTNRGAYVVKGYKDEQHARWVTKLAQKLFENGYIHTVQYVSTVEGEKVFPYDSRYYTVMKAIDGHEADYGSLDDVKKSAATLARFHLAAKGFPLSVIPVGYKPPLIDKWQRRLEEFEQISRTIQVRGAQNRLEELILQMAGEMRRDGRTVLAQAFRMPLAEEMHEMVRKGTLAHRDVASHNFLLSQNGVCHLIDLDTVHHDMQLVDLVQFLGRMLLMQGYRTAAFSQAVDAYSKVRPLSDRQVLMVHDLLRYPDNFLREVTGVYAKRPGYRPRGVLQLLQLEYRLRHARRHFLQERTRVLHKWSWIG